MLSESSRYCASLVPKILRGSFYFSQLYFCFVSQELNNRLERIEQEKKDLLSNLSVLEEKISSAENDRNLLQDRLNLMSEEKNGMENEMALLKESLQTSEKEKQVCFSKLLHNQN